MHRSPYRAILIALILAVGSFAVAACGSSDSNTSIGREYEVAADDFGLTADELVAITQTALNAGFAPDLVRQSVLKRLQSR